MPAVYAHLSFGRRVLNALPDCATKDLIRSHIHLFEIGLQGPDILFFYHPLSHHPVNRIGHDLHEKSGRSFLERKICRQADEKQLAYLLGFICHYALDSECHALVEYYIERTGRGHSDIETDLERYLMAQDGLDPYHHAAALYVQDTSNNAATIAPFYEVRASEMKAALTTMKLVSRVLTPSSALKHKLLTFVGQRMGEGSVVSQLTMDRQPDSVYTDSNHDISTRMEQSIPIAIALMDNFVNWYHEKDTLSQRFQPTFSFDEIELARLKERDTRV